MASGFNHSSPPDNRLNGLSVTKKKNCWCDIRKFMGPPGDVRLNDVHCVCHHRAFSWGSRGCPSPKATLSLMSQRRNNNRLPGGCDSQRFYVPNVLIVWTAYLSITVDFSLSAFFFVFFSLHSLIFHIPCCVGYHYSSVVSERWKMSMTCSSRREDSPNCGIMQL